MRTVAVSYGYGDPETIRAAGPDATSDRFERLPDILDETGP